MSSQCQKIELKKLPFLASDITNFTSAVCAVVLDIISDVDEPKFNTWANTYSADLYSSFLTVNSFSASWGTGGGDVEVFTFVYSNSANILNVNNTVNTFSANWNSIYDTYNSLSAQYLTDSDISSRFVHLSGDIMTGGLSSPSLSTNTLYVGQSTINFFDSVGNVIETLKSLDVSNFKNNYNTVNTKSGDWDSNYNTVNSNSGNWDSNYNTVNSNSGNWDYQGNDIKSLTGDWEDTFIGFGSQSANNINVYSTVNENSGQWNYHGNDIKSLTGNWEDTYNNFNSQSSDNISVYNTVNSNSGDWTNEPPQNISFNETNAELSISNGNSVSLSSLSGEPIFITWSQTYSGNYESTFNTVNSNSGDWNYQGNDIKSLTANWESTFNNFSIQSSNNINVFNTVNSNSGDWINNPPQILSFNETNAELSISNGNAISLSSLSGGTSGEPLFVSWAQTYSGNYESTFNIVNSNSGDWNYQGNDIKALTGDWTSNYNTVNSNSASWVGGGGDPEVNSFVYSNSANILQVNSAVNTNSANWNSVYNTVNTTSANVGIGSIGITIDGAGSAITTGSKGFISVPYNATIQNATIVSDLSGSVVIDVKKSSYADFPSTVSICASTKPTLSSARKSSDSTLTGWTLGISSGDVLEFVVDSASILTKATLTLKVIKY